LSEEDNEVGELDQARKFWVWSSQRTSMRRCHCIQAKLLRPAASGS